MDLIFVVGKITIGPGKFSVFAILLTEKFSDKAESYYLCLKNVISQLTWMKIQKQNKKLCTMKVKKSLLISVIN